MRLIHEPYYSERTKLKLLKSASTEQLIEFLLMMTGSVRR
jgi:hypothetical protein